MRSTVVYIDISYSLGFQNVVLLLTVLTRKYELPPLYFEDLVGLKKFLVRMVAEGVIQGAACISNSIKQFTLAENKENGEQHDIRDLSKPRRQRQRERCNTKGLMSRTMALHVHYKTLYISQPFTLKQQCEIITFCVFKTTRVPTAKFACFY